LQRLLTPLKKSHLDLLPDLQKLIGGYFAIIILHNTCSFNSGSKIFLQKMLKKIIGDEKPILGITLFAAEWPIF
jgi:hypothetical protein